MNESEDQDLILRAAQTRPEKVLDAINEMGIMGQVKISALINANLGTEEGRLVGVRLQGEIAGLAMAQEILVEALKAENEDPENAR